MKNIIFSVILLLATVYNGFATDYMLPLEGGTTYRCSQGFNNITSSHKGSWEHSWDFATPTDTPLLATASATVVFSGIGYDSNSNNILGDTMILDFGNGEYGKYCHLSYRLFNVGDPVTQGQVIGFSGNTGSSSTGPHLHYNLQDGPGIWDSSITSTFVDGEENK